MDIVKANIEKLGGSTEIESELGHGALTRLKMPLTLSVVRSLIVRIGDALFAVPEVNIERIVRITHNMPSRRIERLNDSLVLALDGRVIPLVTMGEMEAKANGRNPPHAGELLKRIHESEVIKCLVLKADGKSFALLIDNAIETEQTLVKPLPEYLKSCLCYSSVTVLGNGDAIAIIDAEGILRFMEIEGAPRTVTGGEAEEEEADDKQIIIFKCSGAEYFALEISEISRIEAINPGFIQDIGSDQYINIAEETVRIVKPESFAPVKKLRYTGDKLYVLTLKNCSAPVGLLAGKVIDKVSGDFKIDDKQLQSDYVLGTGRYNENVLIFIDPVAIAERIEKDRQKKKHKRVVV
jgi:two-component system chemotaxis sensor kinase CheA